MSKTPAPKWIAVAVALVGGLLVPAGPSSPSADLGPAGVEPEVNEIRLTVSGRGLVRSDVPNLIACGGDPVQTACMTVLTRGVVTLRATAAAGSEFVKWTGAPGCGVSSTCGVDASAPRSIAATFKRSSIPSGTSKLRVEVTGSIIGGSVLVNGSECVTACTRSFQNGSTVKLVADESVLQRWSGSCVGAAGTCMLVMSGAETTSAALFKLQATHGVVRVTRSGPGKVESSPPGIVCGTGRNCSASFDLRKNVTLTATPTRSNYTASWPGRSCSGPTCQVEALAGGAPVEVAFVVATDELRVAKSGDGTGDVTSVPSGINCGAACTKRFQRGTRVTLRQQARTGSRFVGWSGACSGAGSCSVVPTAGRTTTVAARFDRIRDELRVTKAGDGQGTVVSAPAGINCGTACKAMFPRQSTVELRATPDGVSRFAGWSGPCSGQGVCSVRLERATAVKARFDRIGDEVRIAKTGRGGGMVTSSPPGSPAARTAAPCSHAGRRCCSVPSRTRRRGSPGGAARAREPPSAA